MLLRKLSHAAAPTMRETQCLLFSLAQTLGPSTREQSLWPAASTGLAMGGVRDCIILRHNFIDAMAAVKLRTG
ncbi:hypothetical protein DWV42_08960 [Collinsella sp. AF05-8-2]|nr:hypothetical protein DWV42_08960 [Collinsella sp. AF05-8-2]RGW95238.1 hypothetical protein DWV43_00030 [Collinsella sp. AF05-9]